MDSVTAAKSDLLDLYVQEVVKKGIKKISSAGAFAYVFRHPTYSNLVVRVSDSSDAGNVWFRLSAKHKNNPWMPRVAKMYQAVVKHPKLDLKTPVTIIFAERLSPFTEGKCPPKFRNIFKILKDMYKVNDPDKVNRLMRAVRAYNDPYLTEAVALMLKPPSDKYNTASLDIHETSNLMMRGDQIVINDPWNLDNWLPSFRID